VGPELTREGLSYPWFIKESMVWPQADLKTSTMPNYKLDHVELEDLMTYLLAQVGKTAATSDIEYKTALQDWEAGKKQPWELPISPAQMHDVRYAMTVFATEGCAACHRLKGFQSNVGYSIEKDENENSFEALYREKEWFKKLIPEMITAKELVAALEDHAAEIDKKIVNGVREDSVIEEIRQKIPGQIESLYTPFRYAFRAKNHFYESLLSKESNPQKREAILAQKHAWQDRVHRVLMTFIQEYGLGRLIGPRPNWSGVYRSDEWLIEHFRNPTGHVARSIMPAFPFDDTKFYALTYMLDHLAVQNRDELHTAWRHFGFNPEQTYQTLCSQCHGEFMQGNGPVSEWIYPIPKNLRNADFLRNLTKERARESIMHGVKGTPMPPWGEVGGAKALMDGTPVLSEDNIRQLVDWMFAHLPGGTVIKGTPDVPKWRYEPEDVLKELQQEGNQPELKASPKPEDPLSLLLQWQHEGWLAALQPAAATSLSVKDVFDEVPNPMPGSADKELYFIKKKYYTQNNILAGKEFFDLNCASCHGRDADGTGLRAAAMRDSKPRMLTNLDWINTRDDLRLLRSIKYGVPGTAMNPWGDLTSSLQRLQLVMYIRTLSQENYLRDLLTSEIYRTFTHFGLMIDEARIHAYPELAKAQQEYRNLQHKRKSMYGIQEEAEESIKAYNDELKALAELKEWQELDRSLLALKEEVAKEKELYQNLGANIIATLKNEEDLHIFLQWLKTFEESYKWENDQLVTIFNGENEAEVRAQANILVTRLNALIGEKESQKIILEGQIASPERNNRLNELNHEINSLNKLKEKLIYSLAESLRSKQRQKHLVESYQSKLKK
jgi:mono/diheme cytochrome c family protein